MGYHENEQSTPGSRTTAINLAISAISAAPATFAAYTTGQFDERLIAVANAINGYIENDVTPSALEKPEE